MTIKPSHHAIPAMHDARLIALGEQLEEIQSKLRPVAAAQAPATGWSPFGYPCPATEHHTGADLCQPIYERPGD